MTNVPSLFVLNAKGRATKRVTPGTEWVLAGEGTATRKWDGVACMLDGLRLPHTEPTEGYDGKWWVLDGLGCWMPVEDSIFAEAHSEAVRNRCCGEWQPGTYELIGRDVAGNAEGLSTHLLMRHGTVHWLAAAPRDYEGLREWLPAQEFEGVVWWREPGNPDAGLAKLDKKAMA
jgi:hypothetical protein